MTIRLEALHGEALEDGNCLLVMRESGGERLCAITLRFPELASVMAAAEGIAGPRPSTHVAWASMIRTSGIRLEKLIMNGHSSDDEILCLLCFAHESRTWTVDCRPSDGLALALRLGAPIECEEHVFNHLTVAADERTKQDNEELLKYFNENDATIPKS